LTVRFLISALVLAGVSGCSPSYSPDTYASNAAQQANKVDQGIIVGVRDVSVSAATTVGSVTGATAGGIAGSQVGLGPVSAFSALGGAVVGGIAGSTVEHVTEDTTAFEYIVRKPNGDLISVTQKDKTPLVLGQKVLVISGTQARVVPDYTVPLPPPPAKPVETVKTNAAPPETKPADTKPADAQPAGATPQAAPPGTTIVPAPATVNAQPAGATAQVAPPGTPVVPGTTVVVPAPVTPADVKTAPVTSADAKPAAAVPEDKPAAPTKPAGSATP
jgi:outer membrane lipoprotein SlyB